MTLFPGRVARRASRGVAVAGLACAAVTAVLWAMPASHPSPAVRADWVDRGTVVTVHLVRRGLDRHGFVYQTRDRVWYAPTAASLDDVRRTRAGGDSSAELAATAQSQWAQYTWYGNNHVYGPDGRGFVEQGVTDTVPYSLAIIVLATPAGMWAVVRMRRRVRRGPVPAR